MVAEMRPQIEEWGHCWKNEGIVGISHTVVRADASYIRTHTVEVRFRPCHTITLYHLKLWPSLNHLRTHVVLVRVACGPSMQ